MLSINWLINIIFMWYHKFKDHRVFAKITFALWKKALKRKDIYVNMKTS